MRWQRARATGQRLYDAEQAAWTWLGGNNRLPGRRFRTWEETDLYAREVQERDWWHAAFHGLEPIRAAPGAGHRGWARGITNAQLYKLGERSITVPQWAWHKPYVLHELLHHGARTTGHGAHFAGWLVTAYAMELPMAWSHELVREFDNRRVSFVLPRQYQELLLLYRPRRITF